MRCLQTLNPKHVVKILRRSVESVLIHFCVEPFFAWKISLNKPIHQCSKAKLLWVKCIKANGGVCVQALFALLRHITISKIRCSDAWPCQQSKAKYFFFFLIITVIVILIFKKDGEQWGLQTLPLS